MYNRCSNCEGNTKVMCDYLTSAWGENLSLGKLMMEKSASVSPSEALELSFQHMQTANEELIVKLVNMGCELTNEEINANLIQLKEEHSIRLKQ